MSKKLLLAVIVAVPALLAAAGVSSPRSATAAEILGTSGPSIRIEAREGRLIKLDGPAETVFIADADIADVQVKTPQLIYIFGKKAGETTLYAVDQNDNLLLNRTVTVTHNLGQLRQSIGNLVPGQGINVQSVENRIVLSGTATSAAAAEDARRLASSYVASEKAVINKIQVDAPQQINLRVRIAEVSRSTAKQLGINWDAVAATGNFVFGVATGRPTMLNGLVPFLPIENERGDRTFNAAGNGFATRNNDSNSVFGNYNNGQIDINGMVDALDDQGLIKVLAEPNLSALSGETASFLAGGEFPVPVPQENNVITISFKKFGVGLSFTPTLVNADRINLKVAPEVSQLSNAGAVNINGFTVPALTVRRAETTVEVGSGQSFAIAGLLQNNSNLDVTKVPWLGDIPILGKLFTSENFQRDQTELIIIVTPYVVDPGANRQIAAKAPAGGGADSFTGEDSGANPTTPSQQRGAVSVVGMQPRRLNGPAGFVLE